jgi:hypothetical protein
MDSYPNLFVRIDTAGVREVPENQLTAYSRQLTVKNKPTVYRFQISNFKFAVGGQLTTNRKNLADRSPPKPASWSPPFL